MTILIFIFLRVGRNFSELSGLITIHTLIFGFFFAGVAEISASISSFCAYQQLFSHPTHSSWFQGFHKTDLYTTSERTAKIRFIEQQTKLPAKDIRVFPIFMNLAEISASLCQNNQNTWSYSPDRPKLAEISARSFKT